MRRTLLASRRRYLKEEYHIRTNIEEHSACSDDGRITTKKNNTPPSFEDSDQGCTIRQHNDELDKKISEDLNQWTSMPFFLHIAKIALAFPRFLTHRLCMFLHNQIMHCGPRVLDIKISDLVTRNARLIRIEKRTTQVGRNLSVCAVSTCNSLPIEIRSTDSDLLSNKRLKKLLMENKSERLNHF